jgi:hypothetical protein
MATAVSVAAKMKGYGWFEWFLYGLMIWPVALVHILVKKPREELERLPCPRCAEPIQPKAALCPHCRSELTPGWAG